MDSVNGVGLPWKGPALVDNLPWPVTDGDTLVAASRNAFGGGWKKRAAGLHMVRLNAELQDARRVGANGVEFSYQSSARAIAVFDRRPLKVSVDGADERAAICRTQYDSATARVNTW